MIPKAIYKLKSQINNEEEPKRISTQYTNTRNSLQIKQKLTRGCQKYD